MRSKRLNSREEVRHLLCPRTQKAIVIIDRICKLKLEHDCHGVEVFVFSPFELAKCNYRVPDIRMETRRL
jgi:hypothetical protein